MFPAPGVRVNITPPPPHNACACAYIVIVVAIAVVVIVIVTVVIRWGRVLCAGEGMISLEFDARLALVDALPLPITMGGAFWQLPNVATIQSNAEVAGYSRSEGVMAHIV
jgi:hypothetical protein